MSTVLAPSLAGSAALRATPWVAGTWALTFACLSALALLDRAPHPWSPNPATALERIEAGAFATCQECGAGIEEARLVAVPHATHCRRCAKDV